MNYQTNLPPLPNIPKMSDRLNVWEAEGSKLSRNNTSIDAITQDKRYEMMNAAIKSDRFQSLDRTISRFTRGNGREGEGSRREEGDTGESAISTFVVVSMGEFTEGDGNAGTVE